MNSHHQWRESLPWSIAKVFTILISLAVVQTDAFHPFAPYTIRQRSGGCYKRTFVLSSSQQTNPSTFTTTDDDNTEVRSETSSTTSTTTDSDDDVVLSILQMSVSEDQGVLLDPSSSAGPDKQDDEDEQRTKYIMLGLLWMIACLSALDRVAMSVALVPMSTEFDLTDTAKGAISSLFSAGYGLAILPAGLVVAHMSPRNVMAVGLATWSLATVATPLSTAAVIGSGMVALLVARAFVGAGESVILPTTQRLLSTWTTSQEKSTALAAIYSGFHAGTIAAYLVSPLVMDTLGGWRGLFYLYGAVGLFILLPWFVLAQDAPAAREDNSSQSAVQVTTEKNLGLAASWEEGIRTFRDAPWKDLQQSKGVWAMLLAHCAKNWGLYNSLAWTPTFYSEQYDIGVRDSALLSVLPSITGAVGGIVAGIAADFILRNMKNDTDEQRTLVRKAFQCIAFLGPAFALAAMAVEIPDEPWLAQFFLMAVIGLQSFNSAGFEVAIQEKAGERWAGLLYSLTSLPAVLFGTAGVYITGRVLDLTNSWSYVFGLNAFVNVLGAAAFVVLYNSKREFD